jgi:ubiquinone/menaquinone biosynthesis C-methylase UbiE
LRPSQLAGVMEAAGLCQVRYQMLMLGTVALHVGVK